MARAADEFEMSYLSASTVGSMTMGQCFGVQLVSPAMELVPYAAVKRHPLGNASVLFPSFLGSCRSVSLRFSTDLKLFAHRTAHLVRAISQAAELMRI